MDEKNFIYDDEELTLIDEMKNSEWKNVHLSENDKEKYAKNAIYNKSLKEKKQTTIRFCVSDLAIVKARAKELGIGYQNLIQALVHNYTQGKMTLKL